MKLRLNGLLRGEEEYHFEWRKDKNNGVRGWGVKDGKKTKLEMGKEGPYLT